MISQKEEMRTGTESSGVVLHDMIKRIYFYFIIFSQKRNGKRETHGRRGSSSCGSSSMGRESGSGGVGGSGRSSGESGGGRGSRKVEESAAAAPVKSTNKYVTSDFQ